MLSMTWEKLSSIGIHNIWFPEPTLIDCETGWELGPFAAVLQCLHLDTPLLDQQNIKKL